MRYRQFTPAPDLQHAVEHYWLLEGVSQGIERIFPDGHCELAIHLGDRVAGQPNTLWIGQLRQCVDIAPSGILRVFGVRMLPEAAMLAAPRIEEIVDLAGVWPGVPDWRQRLGSAASISEMSSLTDKFLRSKLTQRSPDQRVARAVRLLQQHCRLDSVASTLGLSPGQLQSLFQAHVGMEPKLFARIARFQRALQAERTTDFNWTRIAHDCGYYDQAHLISDFWEFKGEAPTGRPVSAMGDCLAARRGPQCVHPPT